MSNLLILPGHPLFDVTLASTAPPGWQKVAAQDDQAWFVVQPGSAGLLTPVSLARLDEYTEDGEWEARMQEMGDDTELEELGDSNADTGEMDGFPISW